MGSRSVSTNRADRRLQVGRLIALMASVMAGLWVGLTTAGCQTDAGAPRSRVDIASPGHKPDLYKVLRDHIINQIGGWDGENWDIIIGIDTSRSMTAHEQLSDAASLVRTFLVANLVPGDRARVFEIGPYVLRSTDLRVPSDPDPDRFRYFLGRIRAGTDVPSQQNPYENTDLVAAKLHALKAVREASQAGRNAMFLILTDEVDQPPATANGRKQMEEFSRILGDVHLSGIWLYSLPPNNQPCLSVIAGYHGVGGPKIAIPQNGKIITRRFAYRVDRGPVEPPPPPPSPPPPNLTGFIVVVVLVLGVGAAFALTRRVAVTIEQVTPPGPSQTFEVGRGVSVAIGGGDDEPVYYPIAGVSAPIAYVVGQFPRRVVVRKSDEDDTRTQVVAEGSGLSWRVQHRKVTGNETVVRVRRGIAPAAAPEAK